MLSSSEDIPSELLYQGFVSAIAPFIALSSYCYFGNAVTTSMEDIAGVAYNLDWPAYPMRLKKNLILVMMRSQRSFYFSGLGLIDCSMESLAVVRFLNLVQTPQLC